MAVASVGGASMGGLIIPIAFLAIFYFFAIRPQRKRDKQIKEMRASLRVGDEVITIGGINGKIAKIKDEEVTIEVGADKTKLVMTKWAIGSTVNKQEMKDNGSNK